MANLQNTLEKLGLFDKEIKIYLTLLSMGPTSIRKIAEKAAINRGTTYELLKKLQQTGLVSYFHQGKRQHFVTENPSVIANILARKKTEIGEAESDLGKIISELSSISKVPDNRPVIKFYENYSGIRTILEDVLSATENLPKKEYAVYSSSTIRSYLYHKDAFPDFTDKRIKRKVHVRTIAIGSGGNVKGEDERKWLTKKEGAPTYTILYAGKVAMISVGLRNIPHGLIIEDEAIYEAQLLIFNSLWKTL
ncbi:TrmB family transcriptional regulator [Candidatus Nomurabacteria bacterium]|nr:TrmB family transcriptional regulator [Candidatus Nomurabacteria bacterium]